MTSPRPAHLAAADVPVARGPQTAQSDTLNGARLAVAAAVASITAAAIASITVAAVASITVAAVASITVAAVASVTAAAAARVASVTAAGGISSRIINISSSSMKTAVPTVVSYN